MTLFDLLFLASFLCTVGSLGVILYFSLRRRRAEAARLLRWLGGYWGVYMAVLIAVSLLSARRVIPSGEDLCFDDWCMAVERAVVSGGTSYAVTLRISSRALRVTQRETGARVQLMDADGRIYDPRPAENQPPLSAAIGPGESFETTRVFDVPAGTHGVVLIRSDGPGPGWFVIGDSASLFHKRTIFLLPT